MPSFLAFALTVFLSLFDLGSTAVYHITPASAGACPERLCITLSQFAVQFNNPSSNTTLIFKNGYHNFTMEIMIENILEFAMFSNSSSSTIACEESARWSFISVENIRISNINFAKCNFQVDSVARFDFEKSTVSDHTGIRSVLELFECSAYIKDSHFMSNSVGSTKMSDQENITDFKGAVITTHQSNAVIISSSFYQNSAVFGGVMVTKLASNISCVNCSFVENHASSEGGVFYSDEGSSIIMYNSSFQRNIATKNGGVFMMINSALSIYQSFFTFNQANNSGGILCAISDGTIIISESNFTENTAFTGGALAGYNISQLLVIKESYFGNNEAVLHGGAIYMISGSLEIMISDSVFSNNVAGIFGGAIYPPRAVVNINSTLFINNSGNVGGAVSTDVINTTIAFKNCSFWENYAINGGVIHSGAKCSITVFNSTFQNNFASKNGGVFLVLNSILSIHWSFFSFNKAIHYDGGVICAKNDEAESDFESVIISDTIFTENSAQNGGVLAVSGIHALITEKSQFSKNKAAYYGGAIYLERGTLTIIHNSIFVNNTAYYFTGEGGAIYSVSAFVKINNAHFITNQAVMGGALSTDNTKITLSNSFFIENNAFQEGGTLYSQGYSVTSYNSTFQKNMATIDGGVFMVINTDLSINQSFFSFNTVTNDGGVICATNFDFEDDKIIIINSNFSDNSAHAGGVLAAYDVYVLVKDNCHFRKNKARICGGAVYVSGGSLNINSSVFSQNTVQHLGGAIYSGFADLSINVTLFINNAAEVGGTLCIERVKIRICNCDFINNTATVAGAVIFSSDMTSVNNYNSFVEKNNGSQGIMYFMESSATFTGNTTITNNFGSLIFYYSSVCRNANAIAIQPEVYYKKAAYT